MLYVTLKKLNVTLCIYSSSFFLFSKNMLTWQKYKKLFIDLRVRKLFLNPNTTKKLLNRKSEHDNNFYTKSIVVMNCLPWATEALIGVWLWTALVNEAFQRSFIGFKTVALKGQLHLIVLVASPVTLFCLLSHKRSQHGVYIIFLLISRRSNS